MPYKSSKVPHTNCYRVYKPATKKSPMRIFAKCATLTNAKKQLRLLRALKYNPSFKMTRRQKRQS